MGGNCKIPFNESIVKLDQLMYRYVIRPGSILTEKTPFSRKFEEQNRKFSYIRKQLIKGDKAEIRDMKNTLNSYYLYDVSTWLLRSIMSNPLAFSEHLKIIQAVNPKWLATNNLGLFFSRLRAKVVK
jgi:hypothetical protein